MVLLWLVGILSRRNAVGRRAGRRNRSCLVQTDRSRLVEAAGPGLAEDATASAAATPCSTSATAAAASSAASARASASARHVPRGSDSARTRAAAAERSTETASGADYHPRDTDLSVISPCAEGRTTPPKARRRSSRRTGAPAPVYPVRAADRTSVPARAHRSSGATAARPTADPPV